MPAGTPIYLDNAATTPLRREALEAMLPYLTEQFGNPSSPHAEGQVARNAVENARTSLAETLGADPRHLLFTSGATEAIHLALHGALAATKNNTIFS